jgi:hypothetical protein
MSCTLVILCFVGYVVVFISNIYVSCQHLKENTSQKTQKNYQFRLFFYTKPVRRFIDSGTDKMIISTDLSVISAGLPVKADFQPCRN